MKHKDILRIAIPIAAAAHDDQTRFNGDPYIFHPIRVMMAVEEYDQKIVAILHDVIEYTDITIGELAVMLDLDKESPIIQAIDCLTKKDDMDYSEYIQRIGFSHLTRKVKMADLKDNLNLLEIPEIKEKHLENTKKYYDSYKYLEQVERENHGH